MQNRRSPFRYLAEPEFQFRFIGILAVASLVQISITVFILYYFLRQNYLLLVKYAGLDGATSSLLVREFRGLSFVIGATFLIHLFATLFLGLVFSHRIGGAVYALKRAMRDVIEGKEAKLILRQGDEFQEMAQLFNQMIESVSPKSSRQPPTSAVSSKVFSAKG